MEKDKLIVSDYFSSSIYYKEDISWLKDLNKFPAKYIPIPFTKGQRKKALDASNKATTP